MYPYFIHIGTLSPGVDISVCGSTISLWQCLHSRTSDNAVRLAPAVDTSGERVQDDCGTDFHLHENTQCEMRSLFDVLDEPWAKLKRQIAYMML